MKGRQMGAVLLVVLARLAEGRLGGEDPLVLGDGVRQPGIINTEEIEILDMRPKIFLNDVLASPATEDQFVEINMTIPLTMDEERRRLYEFPDTSQVDRTAQAQCTSTDCTYSCEALHFCHMPKASATDYWDANVEVTTKYYQLLHGKAVPQDTCCDTSAPSVYLMKFDAEDRAGNKAQQITIELTVLDTISPVMQLCGYKSLTLEAASPYTPCHNSTSFDNVEGDISDRVKIEVRHNNENWLPENDFENMGEYGPHNMTLHTGVWTIRYSSSDESNNTAYVEKFVTVQDTTDPRITLEGAGTVLLECQTPYTDAGATAVDSLDGPVNVREYGGKRRSCMDILMEFPLAETGIYWIENDAFTEDGNPHPYKQSPFNHDPNPTPGHRLWVLCDMDTDGGGYTYYPIHNGVSRNQYSLLPALQDSCQQRGLDMAIWRTERQLDWLLKNFSSSYFKVVPGLVGQDSAVGVDLTQDSMNSEDPYVTQYYSAIDSGNWFLRSTPFSEPSGNYQTGCYLGVFGFNPMRFNDDYCKYWTGDKYICSTNDKGGKGLLQTRQELEALQGIQYPPVDTPGRYTIVYQATDRHGNNAISQFRNILVEDTVPPTATLNEDQNGDVNVVMELYMSEIREATGGRIYQYDCTDPDGNLIGTAGEYRHITGRDQCSVLDYSGNLTQFYCLAPNACTNKRVYCPSHYRCEGEGLQEKKFLVDPGAVCQDGCSAQTTQEATWNQDFRQHQAGGFTYIRTYACTDESQNVGATTRTWIYVDDISPSISIHGPNPYYIEAFPNSTYTEHDAECTDKQDCDCEKLQKPCTNADGEEIVYYCLELHEIRQHTVERTNETTGELYDEEIELLDPTVPGNYKVWFRCTDSDGLHAPDTWRSVLVQDTICPTMSLKGPPLIEVEAGFAYTDVQDPATAYDVNCICDISEHVEHVSPLGFHQSYGGIFRGGDTVNVGKSYYTRGSCLEILNFARNWNYPDPETGFYLITTQRASDGAWLRTNVYCDMDTDGGGYTEFEVRDGTRTSKYTDPDTCQENGLQILVPRTRNHLEGLIDHWTSDEVKQNRQVPPLFTFVPGIYGTKTGKPADMSEHAMTSDSPIVANVWKALDRGPWYLWGTKASNFEPSGDYTIGCWMGMLFPDILLGEYDRYQFVDDMCIFSDTNYLCSTNDKGGAGDTAPGPDHAVVANGIHNAGPYPEGAERGKFVIKYHVEDMGGNRECVTPQRTVIVKDTMVPRIFLYKNGSLIGYNASYKPDKGIGGWNDLSRYETRSYYNLTDLQINRAKALNSDGTQAYSTLIGEFKPFQQSLLEVRDGWFSLQWMVVAAPTIALAVAYVTGSTGVPQRESYDEIKDCI